MKKLFIILAMLLVYSTCYGWSDNDYSDEDKAIVADALIKSIYDINGNGVVDSVDTIGSMIYPGAGIAVSTGSAWDASITNNSANWDTAYGWGDHSAAGYVTAETDPSALKAADIGVTVQAYSATMDTDSTDDFTWDFDYGDLINTPTMFTNTDETDQVFSAWLIATPPLYPGGWYDTVQGTISLSAFNNDLSYADPLGDDDNYVTDAEKTVIGNTSGTNSGDEPDASTTVKGIIEIADDTEALAGTDTSKAMTAAGVKIYADANDTGFANPMTAAGDIIYGGTAGAPTSLVKGANNTLLGIDGSGVLGWQSSFSFDDSAAQFFNKAAPTKLAKISCSGITAGNTRTMTWPDFDFTPAVLGSNLVPASAYYNFGTVAGSDGYGLRDNAGDMEYKNSGGDWAGIGSGGGGSSAGSQYDIQIADDASGFDAVTGEFKYQDHTLYVGTGGLSQAKTSGIAGFFTLYSNNSTDTTGAGLKGPSATLVNSYYLVFPDAEPAATAIWAHAAASSHNSAGSWLYPGTAANNIVQLDGDAKLPAVDGSALTNVSSTPNDTETIYDSDGGSISVTKNNTIVIAGATCAVTPLTPAEGVNLMVQNAPGTTGAITIVNLSGVYYGKADASGYNTVNYKYVSGGANTDRIVLIGIDSTHYIVSSATGTWTDTAP